MYRKSCITGVLCGVTLLIAASVTAQTGSGECGRLIVDVEGGCILFQPYSGGLFTLDNYGSYGPGDEVYVEGTPGTIGNPCPWCGTFQFLCLWQVTIGPCEDGTGCCQGNVGDCNNSGHDAPTIGDLSVLIDYLFVSRNPDLIACILECDVNQSGGCDARLADLSIGDVTMLIDMMFFCPPPGPCSGPPCLVCPVAGR